MTTDRMKGTEETEKKGKEERRARWATLGKSYTILLIINSIQYLRYNTTSY